VTSYVADFAELYDLFHEDKPYEAEAAFADKQLREHSDGPTRRLLDVACGTGQHAAWFQALGWSIVGVDQSEDMLRIARQRVRQEARFLRQDMRSLDVPTRDFDAAICLFDSIGYAKTNAAVLETLAGIRQHLRADGLMLLEFWHAPAMVRGYEPLRVRQWQLDKERVVRVSRTELFIPEQVARVSYSVLRLHSDGTFREWNENHENRFFQVQEMALFLADAGFEPLRWFAGFVDDGAISEGTWHVVALARALRPE
jgi:SAM-dependent methyltransferase